MRKSNRKEKIARKESKMSRGYSQINKDKPKQFKFKPVSAKNTFQKNILQAMSYCKVVVIQGPAGSGKSYVVMNKVLEDYTKGYVDKIYLARPNIHLGSSLGMLKGGIREKYEPFLMPLISVIKESMGTGFYECSLNNENIELIPMEYLRGRNLNGYVVVDESQNCSWDELYSIMTRIGEHGKLVLLGDSSQSDLHGKDGLTRLREFYKKHNLHEQITFIEGDSDDIVRSEFVKAIVKAKENEERDYD